MKFTDHTITNYRLDIQGLRALAVAAVIINHLNKNLLPGGYLGVDIFFVISGYVITSSLSSRKPSSFRDFLLDFYYRRIKRLLPALLLCVTTTFFIGCLFIASTSPHYTTSLKTGIASLFGLSNIYLLKNSQNYFSLSSEYNLFTHTWSLGVEEQFYFIFPAIVYFSGFSRDIYSSKKRKLLFYVGGLSVFSILSFIHLNKSNQVTAFFLMPSRFWELGAGSLAFLLRSDEDRTSAILGLSKQDFLFVLLIAFLFLPLSYQVAATIIVVFISSLMLLLPRTTSPVYGLLSFKPVVYIGLISYSLYLWHWSILVFSRWTLGIHWWSIPFQLGSIFFLSAITHYYIESPMRQLNWSTSRFRSILYAFTASLLGVLFMIGIATMLKDYLYTGSMDKPNVKNSGNYKGYSNSTSFRKMKASVKKLTQECNMTPHHLTGEDFRPKPFVDDSFIRKCLIDSRPKVILVGDSFAQVFATHIALASNDINYDFKILFGYGCPYPLNLGKITSSSKINCDVDSNLLKSDLLKSINPGDIVVLRLYFQKPQYIKRAAEFKEETGQDLVSAYDEEIDALYHDISEKGAALLLIGSNPTGELSLACRDAQWFNALQRMTDCAGFNIASSPFSNFVLHHDLHLIKRYATNYPNMEVVTLSHLLCDSDRSICPLEKNGVPLYAVDGQHITAAAIDIVYPTLVARLQRLIKTMNQKGAPVRHDDPNLRVHSRVGWVELCETQQITAPALLGKLMFECRPGSLRKQIDKELPD